MTCSAQARPASLRVSRPPPYLAPGITEQQEDERQEALKLNGADFMTSQPSGAWFSCDLRPKRGRKHTLRPLAQSAASQTAADMPRAAVKLLARLDSPQIGHRALKRRLASGVPSKTRPFACWNLVIPVD